MSPARDRQQRKRRRTTQKVEKKWLHIDIDTLIAQAELHPCLWDASCADNKDRTRRASSWQEISEVFKGRYTAKDCNSKWQCLRASHRSVCHQLKKDQSEKARTTLPTWRYYSAMSFLSTAEPTAAFTTLPNRAISYVDCTTLSDNSSNTMVEEENIKNTLNETSTNGNQLVDMEQLKLIQSMPQSTADYDACALATKALEWAVEKLQTTTANDNAQVFGNFIAYHLRGVAEHKSKSIQRKLTRVMFDMLDEYDMQLLSDG